MRYPDAFLEELRRAVPVIEAVGRRHKMRKSGAAEYVAVDDNSLGVNTVKNVWRDFGKGDHGGDIFEFEMHSTGCTFQEAVEALAQFAGIPLPRASGQRARPRRANGHDDAGPEPPPAEPEAYGAPALRAQPLKQITAAYDYRDADGSLAYQVCRQEWIGDDGRRKKAFLQRRPHGAVADDADKQPWIWGLGEGVYLRGRDGNFYSATKERVAKWAGAERIEVEACPHVLYRLPELREEMAQADSEKRTVFCYRGDAEVLTPNGWIALPALPPNISVAQWSIMDGAISFAVPNARQAFHYSGEMVHIKSTWCDLAVTSDHRQPVKHEHCKPQVLPATEVTKTFKLPVAGIAEGSSGPSADEARLIAAWIADGVRERRGNKVSWNLKKERKKTRLRELLSACGVTWTEHNPPSIPGWTGFRVRKVDLAFIWRLIPEKRWPWSALSWAIAARSAALAELQNWDGDRPSKNSRRFFTSERQSADVICAIAALTGWGATMRIDRRRGSENFIVNLNHKDWRALAKDPVISDYEGAVFCCTVPTGFLVVRQNGKVVISGNCVEGEKDVHTLESWGAIATTNSGGAGNWRPHHAEELRGADVVVVEDHDEAGRKRGHEVALSLRGVAARVRVLRWPLHWPGCIDGADTTDWKEQAGGDAGRFFEIVERLPDWSPEAPASSYGAVRFADIDRNAAPLQWTIKTVLQRASLSLWYGPPASGKSFLVTDAAMAIARGAPWYGQRTRPGLVIYQTGEGGAGFRLRLRAYRQQAKLPADEDVPFVYLPVRINLFENEAEVGKLIEEIKAWSAFYDYPLELVVIDTFNAASGGANENANQDVGRVLERCRQIVEATGAHVAVVHHTPAAGGKPRGHSSLVGDVETTIAVEPTDQLDQEENGPARTVRTWTLTKQKDGPSSVSRSFVLKRVVLGRDEDGDEVSSCVVAPLATAAAADRQVVPEGWAELNPANLDVFRALVRAIRKVGRAPTGEGAAAGERAVTVKDWQDEMLQLVIGHEELTPTVRNRIKMKIYRASARWIGGEGGRNLIVKSDEWVWRSGRKVHMIDNIGQSRRAEPEPLLAGPGDRLEDIA